MPALICPVTPMERTGMQKKYFDPSRREKKEGRLEKGTPTGKLPFIRLHRN
jgi:hypothetical protein